MKFIENEIYHVYNRGNNRQQIFFNERNYIFFLEKIKREFISTCDILAYCLMPNHYHLLIQVKETDSGRTTLSRLTTSATFSRKIGTLQSSYTRAIQIQENITGSLFQQKAK